MILKVIFANSVDPDQTRSSLIRVHTVCLYAKISLKSLQEYSADDINRRHFQMQFFLGALMVKSYSQFFSQKFQHICLSLDVNFNESLTKDVVSFEQLGPECLFCYNFALHF